MSSVSNQRAGWVLWLLWEGWGLDGWSGHLWWAPWAGVGKALGLLANAPSQCLLPLPAEDVFVQQTQDVRNPVIYAVFTSSG